jgi:hypothetical protein
MEKVQLTQQRTPIMVHVRKQKVAKLVSMNDEGRLEHLEPCVKPHRLLPFQIKLESFCMFFHDGGR